MQSTEKNVSWNDQTWSWEVRSPDGKIKSYETLEIAETEAKLVQTGEPTREENKLK